MRRIVLIGNGWSWSLEGSYDRAFKALGYETTRIDVPLMLETALPIRPIFRKLRPILNDRRWIVEVNRRIARELFQLKPEIILVFCNVEILYGTLAFLKTALPTKTVLIWPDTPFNLSPEVRLAAPLYDLVCAYSQKSVAVLERLGFAKVVWVPLACDPELHGILHPPETYEYDISFIGNWRPEREQAFSAIIGNFKNDRIRITGGLWKKKGQSKDLIPYVEETALTGRDYAAFINKSFINLNIIDDTNYPAANMRFFEIPVAYGFQISSACPEQQDVFVEGREIMYFSDHNDLVEKIHYCFSNRDEVEKMRIQSNRAVLENHTYLHRAKLLLNQLPTINSSD